MTRLTGKPAPPPPRQAPASTPAKSDPKQQALETIKRWIGAKSATFETLLGSPEAAKRFGQVLILACLRNPALLTCDLKSLFLAALYCAQRGLEPGVQDGCALVPYKGKVTPIPQYRALVKQAIETGSVKSAKAILIHANDQVEWEEGMNPRFVHKPAPFGTDRGPVVGAYSRIVLPDGTIEIEPMTLEEIYKRRNASAAWRDSQNRDSTPWAMWENEMIKKTALKNGLRTIPVAPKLRDLLESDSRLEGGDTVETVLDLDSEVMDITVAEEAQQDKKQSRTDALADILTTGEASAQPETTEPEPTPLNSEGSQEPGTEAEPSHAEDQAAESEASQNPEAIKLKLQMLHELAIQKQIVGAALQQFKMDRWSDFLAFPELIPMLESFVENPPPQEKSRRK